MSTLQASLRRDQNRVPISGSDLFYASKRITFTGAAGAGAVAALPIFDVQGIVKIGLIIPEIETSLTSAGLATIGLGAEGNGQFFIAPTAFSDLVAGDLWLSDSSHSGVGGEITNGVKDHVLRQNILLDILVSAITGGVMEVHVLWAPISDDGLVIAL